MPRWRPARVLAQIGKSKREQETPSIVRIYLAERKACSTALLPNQKTRTAYFHSPERELIRCRLGAACRVRIARSIGAVRSRCHRSFEP